MTKPLLPAIPVTVIGGYLGSGKTTLVNHLLRNANGKRLAILINEFGELPIDEGLIEAEEGDIISLSGGCVCCSYGNDLMMALIDMAKMNPRPDHIILEASGVALPGAIAGSLSLLNDYSTDGIVVLADAETVLERANDKYMGDTILRQFADADIILLNKIDLVSRDMRQKILNWLEENISHAKVIDVERATCSPAVLLQDFNQSIKPNPSTHHQAIDSFITNMVVPDEAVNADQFAQQLIADNPNLVRAKGFVKSSNGHVHTIQIVGKRVEVQPAPKGVELGVVTISTLPNNDDGKSPI